jgi:hypothetical protein
MCSLSLREVLNKIFWDKRLNVEDYVLTFIHRGVEGDKKTISCKSIIKVGRSWFIYRSTKNMGEVFIPYHRVLEIKNIKTGKVLWKKAS